MGNFKHTFDHLPQKRRIFVFIIILIILAIAAGFVLVYKPFSQEAAPALPIEIPQTNPFEEVKTNPFKDIKTNPFE